MLTTPLTSSHSKGGSLRPLDFETALRAPQQYLRTRVYAEGVVEEAAFLLAEYLASPPVHASVAFPEVTVPIVGAMRHAVKASQKGKNKGKGKEAAVVKTLIERVEESAKWVEDKRRSVSFAPGKLGEVERWESSVKVEETPLGKFVRVQRKAREKRRRLMEKVRPTPGWYTIWTLTVFLFVGAGRRGRDARGVGASSSRTKHRRGVHISTPQWRPPWFPPSGFSHIISAVLLLSFAYLNAILADARRVRWIQLSYDVLLYRHAKISHAFPSLEHRTLCTLCTHMAGRRLLTTFYDNVYGRSGASATPFMWSMYTSCTKHLSNLLYSSNAITRCSTRKRAPLAEHYRRGGR